MKTYRVWKYSFIILELGTRWMCVVSFTPLPLYLPGKKHGTYSVWSRGRAVGIVTAYGLDDREIGVRVPVGSDFSLLHIIQTGCGAHLASYPLGTGGKAAGA
jgi:hypothetical protein